MQNPALVHQHIQMITFSLLSQILKRDIQEFNENCDLVLDLQMTKQMKRLFYNELERQFYTEFSPLERQNVKQIGEVINMTSLKI